ncbi:MAG: translesion DNA synthesis-associated protein ImuA [Rhodocyclaceae bacterium]
MSAVLRSLDSLLQRPDVWRGDRLAATDVAASGFAVLDAELPGGGWPLGALTELLADAVGIGELSLLLPALQVVAREAPVAVVGLPGCAQAPAWAARFALTQLLFVEARSEDVAWSVEQLLACGGLGAVLAWLPAKVDGKALRRLQLAAEGRRSLAFLFRPTASARTASPAPLRVRLAGSREGLRLDILKRRGPPCGRSLLLPVERPLDPTRAALRLGMDGDASAGGEERDMRKSGLHVISGMPR